MSAKEAAVYATDLLLELRNITSTHKKLSFLTYLLEMAFQEAFNASSRMVEDIKNLIQEKRMIKWLYSLPLHHFLANY